MSRLVWTPFVLFLALVLMPLVGRAEDEPTSKAFAFDGENVPLATLLEQAKTENKLVFLDFYAPG